MEERKLVDADQESSTEKNQVDGTSTSDCENHCETKWTPMPDPSRAQAHQDMGEPSRQQRAKLRNRDRNKKRKRAKRVSARIDLGRTYVGRIGAKMFLDPVDNVKKVFYFVVCRFREEATDRKPYLCVFPPQQGDRDIDAEEVSAHEVRECFKLYHRMDDKFEVPDNIVADLLVPLQKCAAKKRYEQLTTAEWEKMIQDIIPSHAPQAFHAMLRANMEEFTTQIVGDASVPYVDPNDHAFELPEVVAMAQALVTQKRLNEENPNFVPRHQSMVPKIKNLKVRKLWLDGEIREDHRWHTNKTGVLKPRTEVPKGVKTIPLIRLYKRKPRRAPGLQEKCRCIANASEIKSPWQITYAPVVKALTVRLFFALTAYYRMASSVKSLHLTTAFIQCFMPHGEHYWLTLPPRWSTPGPDGKPKYWPSTKWVMKIHKYAYGFYTSASALQAVGESINIVGVQEELTRFMSFL